MSKQNLEKALRAELELLNNQIDARIVRGLSYAKEARRHKLVLTTLAHLRKEMRSNWFGRFTFA